MKNLTPTQKFAFLALLMLLFVVWSASATFVASFLSVELGFDPLRLIGSGAVLGPKKIKVIEYAAMSGTGLVAVGYVYFLGHSGRIARTIILLIVVPVLLATNSWMNIVPLGRAAERLEVSTLPLQGYETIFSDDAIGRDTISSFDEFASRVDANFERNEPRLRNSWHVEDEAALRAIFYLNTVANLFSYGNRTTSKGCANLNEQFGKVSRDLKTIGIRYYMDSLIGCCSDYANLLKFLLDAAAIENNMVAIKANGHIFNEAFIAGRWHALDANIGAYYDRSWNEIVAEKDPFSVTLFPVISLRGGNADPRYRPLLWRFRYKTLMVAATGSEFGISKKSDIDITGVADK